MNYRQLFTTLPVCLVLASCGASATRVTQPDAKLAQELQAGPNGASNTNGSAGGAPFPLATASGQPSTTYGIVTVAVTGTNVAAQPTGTQSIQAQNTVVGATPGTTPAAPTLTGQACYLMKVMSDPSTGKPRFIADKMANRKLCQLDTRYQWDTIEMTEGQTGRECFVHHLYRDFTQDANGIMTWVQDEQVDPIQCLPDATPMASVAHSVANG